MSIELERRLSELRARRKPAPSPEELAAKELEARLLADIAAEQRALRVEENEAIIAKYQPTKKRRFFDFDADGEHPATIEYDGTTCSLYTRFVVRGANAAQLERLGEVITVDLDASGKPRASVDAVKQLQITNEIAESCIVYPTPESAGVSPEQHAKNVRASLFYLGAARAEVGKAATELGGVDAAAHRSKS